MEVNIVKHSQWRIPRQFLQQWVDAVAQELTEKTTHAIKSRSLTIAFVDTKEMKRLNSQFRKKNKVTDILSFDGFDDDHLGDLVLCGEVLENQAEEHGLLPRQELGYLVIHGLLHLLGYEHECGGMAAKTMFGLQDRIFETLWPRFFNGVL